MYQGEYTLAGHELSFFSRKLEAQLRFQQIPWHWLFKTHERAPGLEARAGTHFIPLLMTPDKWVIHDTIALGPMLDSRFHQRPVIPPTPVQRACCFILKDAFNHWLGRSCIHTRWCYPDNVEWVGTRFGASMMLDRSIDAPITEEELATLSGVGQLMYLGFGKNVCEYNGVGPDQGESVKADFTLMLEALDTHFEHNDFLLGPRPCLADFALAGASKARYITDPIPVSWLGQYRHMLFDYTHLFFSDGQISDRNWLPDDRVPETLTVVLDYLQRSYFQFARANLAAGLAGERYCECDYSFGPTRARTQNRLNMARLHVRDALQRAAAVTDTGVRELFAGRGIVEHYLDKVDGD